MASPTLPQNLAAKQARRLALRCLERLGWLRSAKKTREPLAAGGLDNPAAQFREFTAECLELAQRIRSPEKRLVYLALARVCFQLALRREKGSDGAHPGHKSNYDGPKNTHCALQLVERRDDLKLSQCCDGARRRAARLLSAVTSDVRLSRVSQTFQSSRL